MPLPSWTKCFAFCFINLWMCKSYPKLVAFQTARLRSSSQLPRGNGSKTTTANLPSPELKYSVKRSIADLQSVLPTSNSLPCSENRQLTNSLPLATAATATDLQQVGRVRASALWAARNPCETDLHCLCVTCVYRVAIAPCTWSGLHFISGFAAGYTVRIEREAGRVEIRI